MNESLSLSYLAGTFPVCFQSVQGRCSLHISHSGGFKMKLGKSRIAELRENSKTAEEFIDKLYTEILGSLSQYSRVKGIPKVNRKTDDYIMDCLFFYDENTSLLWLNYGFSIEEYLKDWEVSTKDMQLISA
jgi:hypothetical protein